MTRDFVADLAACDKATPARSAMPAALGVIKRIHVYATMVAADSDSTEDERSLMINIKSMIADEYGDTVK